jgi:hypothetical protein
MTMTTLTNEELLKLEPTQRGFMRAEFKDLYGNACSIQESSLATNNCIWLGCEHETVATNGDKCGARMHLTQTMARELSALLLHFAENGDLRPAAHLRSQTPPQALTVDALWGIYATFSRWRNGECGDLALFEAILALFEKPAPTPTPLTRRDDLHNVIARIMKQPTYNSSEICDAVEQYLERLPASTTGESK